MKNPLNAQVEWANNVYGSSEYVLINPATSTVTRLVMCEGHLWGQKDVPIPLSAMGDAREDTVFLKLSKHQVEYLPTFQVNRRWS